MNILGCVSWEHGQDFLLGRSISLRGSSSYSVTLFLVVTLRACDAHAGGVNVNKAQGLPWATTGLVEPLIPAFMLSPHWNPGPEFLEVSWPLSTGHLTPSLPQNHYLYLLLPPDPCHLFGSQTVSTFQVKSLTCPLDSIQWTKPPNHSFIHFYFQFTVFL